MTYLFLGQDLTAKDAKLAEIKKQICPSPESLKFDCETLYAQKLGADELKKALMAIPAFSQNRLVIVKECHKLSEQNKELVLDFIRDPGRCVLVLDSQTMESSNTFAKKLGRTVKILQFKAVESLNVFKLGDAIAMKKPPEALKILTALLTQGDQPLQIMGGLVWCWKNARRGFSSEVYKKGLLALQEADINIKRSRLEPEHALEVLVVKLCSADAG